MIAVMPTESETIADELLGLIGGHRTEALKRLREQSKDAIKIDESFVQEAKVDGGAGSATDEEDEY